MGDYHLLCQCLYKQGDRVGEMFSVAVSPNETIATIKDLIQTQLHPEYAKEFTVPALTLWKLSNPLAFSIDDPNPQEKVDVLLERFRQNPTSVAKALFLAFVVSDYFKTTPESRSLHLIVEGPHASRKRRASQDITDRPLKLSIPLPAPSTAGVPNVFQQYAEPESEPGSTQFFQCNRPIDGKTIPLALFHPVFGKFEDDFHQLQLQVQPGRSRSAGSAADFESVRRLSVMAGFFRDKDARRKSFIAWFQETFSTALVTKLWSTGRDTDGHVYASSSPVSKFITLITEGRNEITWNTSDPRFQAILHYREYVKERIKDPECDKVLEFSCLPALLITYYAANIQISGIVTHPNGMVQSEVLSPTMSLDCDWRNDRLREMTARLVGALRNALSSLSTYYSSLSSLGAAHNPILYPYQRSYTPIDGQSSPIPFQFIERLWEDRLLFKAQDRTGLPLFIKFTRRYCKEAHQLFEERQCAPKLYGIDVIHGGWLMVTMEFASPEEWVMLSLISPSERGKYKEHIELAVKHAHLEGYVHGDIRDVNILVPMSTSTSISNATVWFTDFDEAGPEGIAKYPRDWNTKEVKRPDGAFDGALITSAHDNFMMEQMFK